MNKIISANINGFVIQIDELAYTKLKAYLDMVRLRVGNAEVAQDIENRIAELFNEKLKSGRQAIFDSDVDEVMQRIGSPEEFADDEQGAGPDTSAAGGNSEPRRKERRLYRDNDEKVIGGVCSGIAAYFGLDPVFIRLAFAASFFFFGTGVVLYIVLMVVIPKAVTPAEKLEMRGDPVDYKNVSKTVEKDFREAYDRYKPGVNTGLQRFLSILVKVGFIALAIFILSVVVPGMLGIITGIGVLSWSLPALSAYFFTGASEALLIWVGLILFVVTPAVSLVWMVLRLIFRWKPMHRYTGIVLSLLWFSGFCMLAYSAFDIGKAFSVRKQMVYSDTMRMADTGSSVLVIRSREEAYHADGRKVKLHFGGDRSIELNQDEIQDADDLRDALDREIAENVELSIRSSYQRYPVLHVLRKASGSGAAEALANADDMVYRYELRDSVLILSNVFSRSKQNLWRNQKVELILEIPEHYTIYLHPSLSEMLEVEDEEGLYGRFMKVGEWVDGKTEQLNN